MVVYTGKFKNSKLWNSGRPTPGHHPHNNQSETNHHARDDITPTMYNDVSRERSVDSEQEPRSQSSEDAGHSRRRNIRE
jgi:hypothetical protein